MKRNRKKARPRYVVLSVGMALGSCLMVPGPPLAAAVESVGATQVVPATIEFDIPAQPLVAGMLEFARQSGVQVFFDNERFAGLQGGAVQGRYSLEEALQRLLASAPVSYRFFEGGRQVTLSQRQTDGDVSELPDVTVRGWLSEKEQTYLQPRSVAVIDREQIDRRPPRHAADMLEETSGVYTAVNQRDPGLSVNIRGIQDYGRVNMNIDGMRQNFNVNGHQQRNGVMFVDPEFIDSVEIDKGTSAGMGGAGVLGGIASFNTVEAREFLGEGKEFGGRLRAGHGIGELGNGTYFNGSALFAFGNEIGDLLLGVSERHFGDYRAGTNDKDNLGTEIRLRKYYPEAWEDWLNSEVGDMDSVTRSRLFKLGVNLPESQRLQLSYMEYDTDSKEAWTYLSSDLKRFEYGRTGASDIIARNTALDYSYNPDNDLIDFKAKFYYVSTRQDRWNAGSTASQGSGNWYPDYTDKYRTDTWGLQLQNTSRFYLGDAHRFAVAYGGELFRDSFKPSTTRTAATNETSQPYIKGATPEGERTMGSLFGQMVYDYDDWLTVDAGLRYDRFRLKGDTGLTVWTFPEGQFLSSTYVETPLVYDVDREEGRFSPTLGVAVKPGLDWLQLYTRWGRGWRPPAVTEAFMSGRPHGGGGNEMVYPNPFLEAEHSHNWEAGFNVFKESLLRDGDRLGIKVAYFDTRIDNFSFMDINVSVPGETVGGIGLGRSAYQNNLEETRFRGVEYSLITTPATITPALAIPT
ncbi:heme acquisition TonB-dependent receptor protein HasR [Pseudomonas sp. BAY1663]|nr:TonB-dependent receptor [Pseudomonas sp. BAY1663]EXF46632.1 heme acquisition TonB-dependent receptor protein HasR [Pseudomonas sp. BAY1663]